MGPESFILGGQKINSKREELQKNKNKNSKCEEVNKNSIF